MVAVAAGNPLGIQRLADLPQPDVRLSLPNPDTAAIGRVVKAKLADQWPDSGAGRVVRITVGDVATDVKLGVADAGFVWDETVIQLPGLAAVELSELAGVEAQVAVAVLTNGDAAGRCPFVRPLSHRAGSRRRHSLRRGFRTIPGEPWSSEGR